MNINMNGRNYEVTVKIHRPGYLMGTVINEAGSKVRFAWDTEKYSLPYVKGHNDSKWQKYFALLIRQYDSRLLERRNPTPVPTQPSDERTTDSSSRRKGPVPVKGTPMWLTEMKEWTMCTKKNGSEYSRRTRYTAEGEMMARKFLPHCNKCSFVESCHSACHDPLIMSHEYLMNPSGAGLSQSSTSSSSSDSLSSSSGAALV